MFLEFLYQTTRVYLFESRLFSTGIATLVSFLAAMILFQPYISLLRKFKVTSEFEASKGTNEPVMPAGILFLFIITPISLLCCRMNSYVFSALIIYVVFAVIGAIDDIAKVVNNRKLALGIISKKDHQYKSDGISARLRLALYLLVPLIVAVLAYKYIPNINGHITVPFLSIHKIFPYLPFWIFILLMTAVIAVMANGVNFTDGFDTLAAVPLITCATFVGIVSYISSNILWSSYLLIPYIAGVEEVLPIIGATIGVILAFLWFNSPPSSIIMGDSGAVGLGGMIGIMFVFIKAEFYIPIVGIIFLMEFVSDILQIGSYKLTKKRIFLMAPIHHHFQLKMKLNPRYAGNPFAIKSKITWRFHIISVVMLVLGLIIFLKVR